MNNQKNTQLGKKILYSLVIAMSVLVLLLNTAGIVGLWMAGVPLSNAAVAALKVVENSAKAIQKSTGRVDDALAKLQGKVTDITDATQQISKNVSDKGLVLTLLPEEKEQQITKQAGSLRDTFNEIKGSVTTGLDLYRSIDAMPFINLPGLSTDQMNKIESSVAETQSQAETLRSEVAAFRSGASEKVDKVEAAASKLNEKIQSARDEVAKVNSKLTKLEEFSIRMQKKIPGIFITISVILTLIFAFVIWTQVEMVKKYLAYWRLLSQDEKPALPVENPADK
jgi:DNA repair exonuclease SbcCD ATPase subunit